MERIKWNEEEITKHLKGLPDINDRQSKQELFLRIQANVKYKQNKGRRIPTWGIPALATACAIAIMAVFVPDLMKNSTMDKAESGNKDAKVVTLSEPLDKEAPKGTVDIPVAYHEPMLKKDLESNGLDWVTVAYLDEQAQLVIPVSFVTNKGYYVDKVNEQLRKFDPASAGLVESPLKRAKINEEEETVIIDWPPGSIFSAEEGLLKSLISLTFSNEKQKYKVEFRSNGEQGYEFSHIGKTTEMDIGVPGAPHFRYDALTKDAFIVSLYSTGKDADEMPADLEEALGVMDDEQERGLKPLLPKDLKLKVNIIDDNTVEITFPDSNLLEDDQDSKMMVDAILLTAKSYGYNHVKFKNTGEDAIGPYQMDRPIEDVAGINFYNYQ
jgi:hypothetical protein